jgi:hypothetical protein
MYCINFIYNCIDYISSFFKEFYDKYNSNDIYEEEIATLIPTKIKKPTSVNTDFDSGFEFIDKSDQNIV